MCAYRDVSPSRCYSALFGNRRGHYVCVCVDDNDWVHDALAGCVVRAERRRTVIGPANDHFACTGLEGKLRVKKRETRVEMPREMDTRNVG